VNLLDPMHAASLMTAWVSGGRRWRPRMIRSTTFAGKLSASGILKCHFRLSKSN
jgi:hypothetical protein